MFAEEKEKLEMPVVGAQRIAPVHVSASEVKFSACPDCGSPLYAEEGCFKCSNSYCGYSKCS